ncbi:MAG: pirin family protein [Verrucomicrobiales bacterium]|jgi:redox-sensitive bicupin YhaK (pirin superfamily)|nr:pirin family protein [Verrucomicrobiales bacterium]
MIQIIKADDRGHADHGWLNTYHSFSFADYYNPQRMGFRSLRVINEDRVQGGMGFDTHPHRDFEIISYVLNGALKHQDSMGHQAVMRAGEVQRISAGTGISHSEYNNSPSEPVHFLQIWLVPAHKGAAPDYAQQSFAAAPQNKLTLVCSPDGEGKSIRLNQDAKLFIGKLEAGKSIDYPLTTSRHAWAQLIEGDLSVNGTTLNAGDGAAVSEETALQLASGKGAHFLLFDLA